jgi:hypothetical protein
VKDVQIPRGPALDHDLKQRSAGLPARPDVQVWTDVARWSRFIELALDIESVGDRVQGILSCDTVLVGTLRPRYRHACSVRHNFEIMQYKTVVPHLQVQVVYVDSSPAVRASANSALRWP